jgi:hypothetical protein
MELFDNDGSTDDTAPSRAGCVSRVSANLLVSLGKREEPCHDFLGACEGRLGIRRGDRRHVSVIRAKTRLKERPQQRSALWRHAVCFDEVSIERGQKARMPAERSATGREDGSGCVKTGVVCPRAHQAMKTAL